MLLRDKFKKTDKNSVREILESTKFFRPDEVEVALSILDPKEYDLLFLDDGNGKTVGYTCYGATPCTVKSYDLYWIAVHKDCQGKGYGGILLDETLKRILKKGGKNIFIETSGQELYISTRKFYEKQGCKLEAVIKDFYDDGDDKYIYAKRG